MEKKLGLCLLAIIALFVAFIWWDGRPEPVHINDTLASVGIY